MEVLEVENVYSSHVPSKRLDNTLRFTKSEEDLTTCYVRSNGSPHPEFSIYGGTEFDDAECWSQEDDEILQVRTEQIIHWALVSDKVFDMEIASSNNIDGLRSW